MQLIRIQPQLYFGESALHLILMESRFTGHQGHAFPTCPVCGGVMELVYSRFGENVVVCVDCQTGLTIPRKAWEIADVKKQQKVDKPDQKAG